MCSDKSFLKRSFAKPQPNGAERLHESPDAKLNQAQKYRSAAESGEIGKKHQQLRPGFTIWRMEIEAGEDGWARVGPWWIIAVSGWNEYHVDSSGKILICDSRAFWTHYAGEEFR